MACNLYPRSWHFFWMNEEQLGFDPTFITENGLRFIEIQRNGNTERLIIDGLMMRARCISGRATTCWKAHREGDPNNPLVIKDSWQYTEREEEGELLREATDKGVRNVARYYHHETVRVFGMDDDVQSNVRKGLDVTKAENYWPGRFVISPRTSTTGARKGRSSGTPRMKRLSSQTDAPLPPSKRSCSTSSTKAESNVLSNRVHRRVILGDYGDPIYKASTPAALLNALKDCIEGHESLHKAGFLHRDISINNLMINEDKENPSWPSFLIDLDLAIKETRVEASGARGRTGTRAFMAIGVLFGRQHSFMHDLESIFWVLFWICIHYNGPNQGMVVEDFENWNYVNMKTLARLKFGIIGDEALLMDAATDNFTPYFQPLIPWVNRLREVVFPNGMWHRQNDKRLYSQMKEILQEACENLT
ncbi:c231ed8c-b5cd-4546-8ae8-35b7bc1eec0a [Sclerotinia trifoliorum]|uniref:non-specific serine/threonine protein kinase n=1 Tax=Sclerotinia trifoliorum TaxID=28548 RepID=A0A8H2ZRD2_9HELO|nr:c231ed8c-b5cd-4546-8ae8-35b7bc1eec0a [Sclerotinia trifoliorum]